jgi:hypothetical protein
MWTTFSSVQDMNALKRQGKILEEAADAVEEAIDNGLVPLQYINKNDLGAIVNFVFQGINDTGNQEISTIGSRILRSINKYDSNTGQVQPFLQ